MTVTTTPRVVTAALVQKPSTPQATTESAPRLRRPVIEGVPEVTEYQMTLGELAKLVEKRRRGVRSVILSDDTDVDLPDMPVVIERQPRSSATLAAAALSKRR